MVKRDYVIGIQGFNPHVNVSRSSADSYGLLSAMPLAWCRALARCAVALSLSMFADLSRPNGLTSSTTDVVAHKG
jgi:hypothetical protein